MQLYGYTVQWRGLFLCSCVYVFVRDRDVLYIIIAEVLFLVV